MTDSKYNFDSILQGIKNPSLVVNEVDRILRNGIDNAIHLPQRFRFQREYGAGISIMEKEWDYLIILDACRYDIFKEAVEIKGDLGYVISQGSHSLEFFKKNFDGKMYHDTVYVTANGYGARVGEGVFHDLIFTDEKDAVPDVDVLHSSSRGLEPSTVYNAVMDAYEKYPNKRLIAHFMQPHDPYLGPEAEKLRQDVEDRGLVVRSRIPEKIEKYSTDEKNVVNSLAAATRKGYITESQLREVYRENLEIVLEYVEKLLAEMKGKIVITSDHGELLGEHGQIGHPKSRYYEELRKVPWLSIDSDSRPEIVTEKPTNSTAVDETAIEERLQALGYKE